MGFVCKKEWGSFSVAMSCCHPLSFKENKAAAVHLCFLTLAALWDWPWQRGVDHICYSLDGSPGSPISECVSLCHCFYLCGLCCCLVVTQCHSTFISSVWQSPLAISYLNDRLSFVFRAFSLTSFVVQSSIFSVPPFLWSSNFAPQQKN